MTAINAVLNEDVSDIKNTLNTFAFVMCSRHVETVVRYNDSLSIATWDLSVATVPYKFPTQERLNESLEMSKIQTTNYTVLQYRLEYTNIWKPDTIVASFWCNFWLPDWIQFLSTLCSYVYELTYF